MSVPRETVFISHATPADNAFVRWLGARLTGHGYRVWADIFELHGGTPFWQEIERIIRHEAYVVIAVLSRTSVDPARSGVQNEIALADTVKKKLLRDEFLVPVRLDDVPHSDFPIQVHRLNAIDFSADFLPDHQSLAGYLSLISARCGLDGRACSGSANPATEPTPSGLRGVPDADVADDPLSAVLWSHAAAGRITMFVKTPDGSQGYPISKQAWAEGAPGFLPWETLKTGRLVVARALLGHGSLEVGLDGCALFVATAELNRTLKARPAALATLRAVVQSTIDAAVSSGERPAMRDLLRQVQRDPRVHGISDRQITKVANELKPKDWTRPGRRQG